MTPAMQLTPAQHMAEAERILLDAAEMGAIPTEATIAIALTAQAHALLALAQMFGKQRA